MSVGSGGATATWGTGVPKSQAGQERDTGRSGHHRQDQDQAGGEGRVRTPRVTRDLAPTEAAEKSGSGLAGVGRGRVAGPWE